MLATINASSIKKKSSIVILRRQTHFTEEESHDHLSTSDLSS